MSEEIVLSKYQKKIEQHIIRIEFKNHPNFQCPSVAGSGKSWTLRHVVKTIKEHFPDDTVLILQFNVHIKEEMKRQLGDVAGVNVSTSHAAGMAVLRYNNFKCRVDKNKYYGICRAIVEERFSELCDEEDSNLDLDKESGKKDTKSKKIKRMTSQLTEVSNMAMATLTDPSPEQMAMMIERHSITVKDTKLLTLVEEVIETGIKMAKKGIIAFSDQIYLPHKLSMKHPKYDWVLCDEAQDFNAGQLELVLAHRKKSGKIGSFGDEMQSIMAWAGAMPDSMSIYRERVDARIMPLSVCYRCPSKVLDLARILVPHVENRENCPEGNVEAILRCDIILKAKPMDYVLCRLTAPLVGLCIDFIKKNIRAKVKGRDIGAKLSQLYSEISEEDDTIKTVDQFIGFFSEYAEREKARAVVKNWSQAKIQMQNDSFDAIRAISEYLSGNKNGNSPHNFIKSQIEYIFQEDIPDSFITLCTVHRAKGLEADNVFILGFEKMPFKPPTKDKEKVDTSSLQQELNVMYVALTRAKKNLYIQGAGMNDINDITRHIRNAKGVAFNETSDTVVKDSQLTEHEYTTSN